MMAPKKMTKVAADTKKSTTTSTDPTVLKTIIHRLNGLLDEGWTDDDPVKRSLTRVVSIITKRVKRIGTAAGRKAKLEERIKKLQNQLDDA